MKKMKIGKIIPKLFLFTVAVIFLVSLLPTASASVHFVAKEGGDRMWIKCDKGSEGYKMFAPGKVSDTKKGIKKFITKHHLKISDHAVTVSMAYYKDQTRRSNIFWANGRYKNPVTQPIPYSAR